MQILLHSKMLTNTEFYYSVYLGSFCQLYEQFYQEVNTFNRFDM